MSRPTPSFPRTAELLSRTQPAEYFAGNESLTSSSSQTLSALTSDQVRILDTIISRAPGATTFLAIFKTYNDVLEELSIDASSDVVYYKLLLKLGVVRGRDWGEKWRTVKTQMLTSSASGGYSVDEDEDEEEDGSPPGTPRARAGGYHEQDDITVGSATIEYDHTPQPRAGGGQQCPQPSGRLPALALDARQIAAPKPYKFQTSHNSNSKPNGYTPFHASTSSDSYADDSNYAEYALTREEEEQQQQNGFRNPAPANHHRANSTPIPRRPDSNHVRIAEQQPPPPLRGQTQPRPLPRVAPLLSTFGRFPPRPPQKPNEIAPSTSKPPAPPPLTPNTINADEAWKHLEMERDADDFREISILRTGWHIWLRRSLVNIPIPPHFTTNQNLRIQRSALEVWYARFEGLQGRYTGVASRADTKVLKGALGSWMKRWEARQVKKWTEDMRQRLGWFQKRRRSRLAKVAWDTWRQRHLESRAESQYNIQLLIRHLRRWRDTYHQTLELSNMADDFLHARSGGDVRRCVRIWAKRARLRQAERRVVRSVEARVQVDALMCWRKKVQEARILSDFRAKHLLKSSFKRWKARSSRQKQLTLRANTYIHRRDAILLRAIWHLWMAKERGELLERVVRTKLVINALGVWKAKLRGVREDEHRAIAFQRHQTLTLLARSFQAWSKFHQNRQTTITYSATLYDQNLVAHHLNLWKTQWTLRLKHVKQARIARRWFVQRGAWVAWRERVEEKSRDKKVEVYELGRLRVVLSKWHTLAQRNRRLQLAEEAVQTQRGQASARQALERWTTRLIDIRLREMKTMEEYKMRLQRAVFARWLDICLQHGENLRLMQSFVDVKREEFLRRTFSRWLTATRISRRRRQQLEEREAEIKLSIVSMAWEKWRDRFLEERLRGVEQEVTLQMRTNLVFRSFRIWEDKATTIPAIHFFAARTKARVWRKWKDALPLARQQTQAREVDRVSATRRVFRKWGEKYRAKIALKAVARARYLRLPTSTGAPPTRRSLLINRLPATRSALTASPAPRSQTPEGEPPQPPDIPERTSSPLGVNVTPFRRGRLSLLSKPVSAPSSVKDGDYDQEPPRASSATPRMGQASLSLFAVRNRLQRDSTNS